MCGILGFIKFNGDLELTHGFGDAALKLLQSRGPDSIGSWNDDFAYLGHRRLSIIDQSSAANQPMVSLCGRYVIVFNGEIYNFQDIRNNLNYNFTTASDTETILAAFSVYGVRCLDKFRGMFSFAIWDTEKKELFVARDRLGVKPFYFTNGDNIFTFASRPQALYALSPNAKRSIDKQAVRYFMEAGYIPAPFTIFEGVHKLEPGHFLVVTRDGCTKSKYWSIDHLDTDHSLADADESVLLEKLDSLVGESVRLRMISDVPVGAFLSGGIDSSLVTAYMVRNTQQQVKTFTISLQDKAFDESVYAASVAAHLGTDHMCEVLAVDDLLSLMPAFIKHYDEPFFDYSAFPVMAVSRLARKAVTVSLSGDGGDEAFGGYHYYRIMAGLQKAYRIPLILRKLAGAALQYAPWQRIRWIGQAVAADGPASAYAFIRGVIKDATHLMKPSLLASTQPLSHLFTERASSFPADLSFAEIGMRLDLAYTLPDDYLQKVDVGSMAFSLEARDPLLDHKIIEWAAKLPLCWKIRGGTNKYLLRKLAYRYIPQETVDRPKMGFGVPMAQWLRGDLRNWGESLLEDGEALEALELDAQAVRSLWQAHQSNRIQAHTALWSVLVILQFYRSQLRW